MLVNIQKTSGSPEDYNPVKSDIDRLINQLQQRTYHLDIDSGKLSLVLGNNIRIRNCHSYPYHDNQGPDDGYQQLADDIVDGLKQGLQCIAGRGPMGRQHPYHINQASRLMEILNSGKTKTFQCVEDKTYAYAVARASPDLIAGDYFDELTRGIPYPGVLIDTYRVSGFLTRKHEASTYREFFKLDDSLIAHHLEKAPLQLDGLHRYKNRAALMFHEMTHWLGYVHTNTHPDVVELYETCCFAGDDHISDAAKNREFQQQACNILRDKDLWESSRYKQMRLWRYREYDQLKLDMRAAYDET